MQEIPVTALRAAQVFWSLLWRSMVLLFAVGLAWKLGVNRHMTPTEVNIWRLVALLLYFFSVWWFLAKNSWSEFRVVLLQRDQSTTDATQPPVT